MRIEKLQNKLRFHIANIINQELQNPKVGFVTIVYVKTSKDLDLATIYVNVLGQKEKASASLKALNNASGFIKSSLAKKLKIRKIPKLRFALDNTLTKANKIENIINKIKKN